MTLDQIVCDAEFPDFSQLLQCSGLDCLDQITDMKGTVHFCGGPCPPPPPPRPPTVLSCCSAMGWIAWIRSLTWKVLYCFVVLPPPLSPPLSPPPLYPPPPLLPPLHFHPPPNCSQLLHCDELDCGCQVTHTRGAVLLWCSQSLSPPHPPIIPFPPTPSLSPPPPPFSPLPPTVLSCCSAVGWIAWIRSLTWKVLFCGGPPSVSHFNPFTAVLAALSLEKWPIEVPDFKSLSFFPLGKIWSELKLVWCLLLTFKVVYQDHLTQLLPCAWDFVAKGQWLVWGQVG